MTLIEIIAAAVLGAFAFRLRGGWPPLGSTFAARAVYGAILALMALLATKSPIALLVAPAAFLGAFPGWCASLDLGRVEGEEWIDRGVMLLRGFWFTAPIAVVVLWMGGNPWYFAAGLACLPVYEACWTFLKSRQTEIAEYAFGAAIGGGLWLALAGGFH